MSFDTPMLLALAPVVALVVSGLAWLAFSRRVRAARAWSGALGRAAGGEWWGPALIGIAALLAALALAGPRWGQATVTAKTQSLSLVLAIDISRSMLAEDAAPTRLGHTVREVRRLLQDLDGDRVGLVAFAGRSYILTPLTVDEGAIRLFLDELHPDMASQGGTDLGSALRQGRELLSASGDAADRVLVVFSDGEGHDSLSGAVEEAEALKAAGIRLVVAGQGGAQPVRIPQRDSAGRVTSYKLDENGQVVLTRREDATLRAVADAADGTLVAADLPDQAGAIRDLLRTFKRSPSVASRTADLVPRAWIPILLAVLLLMLQTALRRTASLVALAGLCLLPLRTASGQAPSRGERALRGGDAGAAAVAFLDEVRAGRAPDTAYYNAGTAALRAGRYEVARGALTEATKSLDPGLRYRALYNLGLAAMLEAQADSAKRDALLPQAVEHFQEALQLQPASPRAKWNLELAQRRRPPPSGGGGGGSGTPPPSPSAPQQQQSQSRPEPEPLSQSQAEQILNSMERQERQTRADQIRRMQGGTGGGVKDW